MANPLTVVIDLKPSVTVNDVIALIELVQWEVDEGLKKVGTVHFARFVLFDPASPNLLPTANSKGPLKLAVITSYDGDFDIYIGDFVRCIGNVFNTLLKNSVDGADLVPVKDHIPEFTKFLAANDASQNPPNNKFHLYSAYPNTVQQILAGTSS